ncbi:MAG: FAD-binding oxidoreductase [Nocardioides sp.]
MSTVTGIDGAARTAVESACEQVSEATSEDGVDGVVPALVARPGATSQVAEVMRASAGHGLAVVARGRGTKLTWGRPPDRVDLVIDVSALDQVLDHAAGDLIVETQAGTPLADVQQAVSSARQRLALDETVPGGSIGGILSTGASGPGRVATGTLRDLLIGVTVVRADGAVAKAGGRVVKNVAGDDIGKLMHGSFGTLAVVTEAVFRLHPLPADRRFVSVPVAGAVDAHRLTQAVVHAQVVAGALEVDLPTGGPGTLTVLLEGTDQGVHGRANATVALSGSGAHAPEAVPDGWGRYPWSVTATCDQRATALKLTFALSGLSDVLTSARRGPVPVQVRGSAGSGVVYGAIEPGTAPELVAGTVAALRTTCTRHGGSLVVVDAATAVKATVDSWGPVPAQDLMQRVKDQFDPDHRLAPGRFVGGI